MSYDGEISRYVYKGHLKSQTANSIDLKFRSCRWRKKLSYFFSFWHFYSTTGYITEFLKKIGILERANILSKKMTFKEKANMFYRLKKLLHCREMGNLFKVLFAQKKGKKFSLGF